MNILVTGSKGFLGRNLIENLKAIRDGKNRTRPNISVSEIYEFDKENTLQQLDEWCAKSDFVFNLAGVNRPKDPVEFKKGNVGFASILLNLLEQHGNKSPVMLASSIQASLSGRYGITDYGISKRESEKLFFDYTEKTGVPVYIYRFPNLVGKWVRPNYNSAVGTFCNNIANNLPITVNDPTVELELLFVEDLIEEMYDAIEGHPHRCVYPGRDEEYDGLTPKATENGDFCYVPVTYKATLGYIVDCLRAFHDYPKTLNMPKNIPNSFEKKLYSMYVSYLPKEKMVFDYKMINDQRGSFTELLKTADQGQFSVNIIKPGVVKGQHWHNSKWELFIVVSGHGLIRERKIGSDEVIEYEVSGEKIQAVYMIPGHTHSIINLSNNENLVMLIWANEPFNPNFPDTFYEPVV